MRPEHLIEEDTTRSIIGAFFEVYNTLGFGFFESVYVLALEQELIERGHQVEREVRVPVFYKRRRLAHQRIDMIVDRRVLVECKSTYDLHKATPRQVRSYLQSTPLEVGLLLHFGPKAQFFRIICSNTHKIGANR